MCICVFVCYLYVSMSDSDLVPLLKLCVYGGVFRTMQLLSYQPRVTVTSCFVYKVIED